jgi:hypothetical protein
MVAPVSLQDGTEKSRQIFITIPTEVGQTEAEEIGENLQYCPVCNCLRNNPIFAHDSFNAFVVQTLCGVALLLGMCRVCGWPARL